MGARRAAINFWFTNIWRSQPSTHVTGFDQSQASTKSFNVFMAQDTRPEKKIFATTELQQRA